MREGTSMAKPITPSEKEFVRKASEEQFSQALCVIVGVGSEALKLSRQLVRHISMVPPEILQKLFEWSDIPNHEIPPLVIPEEMREFVAALARHEVGHAIAARVRGYVTGSLTLRVTSASGDHEATAEQYLGKATANLTELVTYLEDRIVILMAGAMSEAPCRDRVGQRFDERFREATLDHARAMEFVQLLENISEVPNEDGLSIYRRLRAQTKELVVSEFDVISQLALSLSDPVTVFGRGWGMSREDFEVHPAFIKRFGQVPDSP